MLHKNQQKFKSNVHYKEPFNCYLFLIHYHIIIIITTITIIVMSLANGVSPNGSLPISSTLLGLILLMKHLDDTISVHTTHISRSSSIADLCNIRHVPPTTRFPPLVQWQKRYFFIACLQFSIMFYIHYISRQLFLFALAVQGFRNIHLKNHTPPDVFLMCSLEFQDSLPYVRPGETYHSSTIVLTQWKSLPSRPKNYCCLQTCILFIGQPTHISFTTLCRYDLMNH